jgi:hypothetical protein
MFRFHLWEPIWYYEPRTKQPDSSLKKARWHGIAHSAGDAMTYFIETEQDDPTKRNVILVRSIIRTRRKNIGTKTKFTNDDPALADFFLTHPELESNKDDAMVDKATMEPLLTDAVVQDKSPSTPMVQNEDLREEVDPSEALPHGEVDNDTPLTPEDMERIYDQFEMEDDANYKFDRILDYEFKDGVLLMKAKYLDAILVSMT